MPSDPSSRRERRDAVVERGEEAVEQRRRDAGAPGPELVGADDHARPDQLRCERPTCTDGVASQQVPLEALALGVADDTIAECADAGGRAVQSLASFKQRRDRLTRGEVALAGGGCELDRPTPPGDGVDGGGRERRTIDHDHRRG